ncbi:MAG TPA: hypothetical protein VN715_09610 [Roseiarcus sp.]|nr:hypothetical protein [Roseiarcus sp.]
MVGQAHIVVTIETREPIEIGNFVSAFTSISSQYSKFVKEYYPQFSPDAKMSVKEIRAGSIIADLIPFAPLLGLNDYIPLMQQADVIIRFVRIYGATISVYFSPIPKDSAVTRKDSGVTRSDLQDFLGSVAAIANDPNGSSKLEAAIFEDGKKKIRAAFAFNTVQARAAVESIEAHRAQLERKLHTSHERVMMMFTQTNTKNSPVDKHTGERVRIEEISDADLPLIYGSELAEQHIKHEIKEEDDNVYKKGFIVDVFVVMKADRPVGYRVASLHQIIDLPT